jgi:hypothetical protein
MLKPIHPFVYKYNRTKQTHNAQGILTEAHTLYDIGGSFTDPLYKRIRRHKSSVNDVTERKPGAGQ